MDPFDFIPVTYYIEHQQTQVIQQILGHYDAI